MFNNISEEDEIKTNFINEEAVDFNSEELIDEFNEKNKVAAETLFVNEFTNGILDPESEMLGPIRDGGTIIANTAPGSWGPMITPEIRGGHEVTKPVFVEGAEVGDSIAIKIKSIQVTSIATASGTDRPITDRFIYDPLIKVKCPGCGKLNPQTEVSGIGRQTVRCSTCDTETSPFEMTNGYTIVFDSHETVGLTVGKEGARRIATNPKQYMRIPEESLQNPIVSYAPSDLIGVMARMRPFLGQIGTLPSIAMPDSYNAGDTGSALVDATHEFSITKEDLNEHRTDAFLENNRVREGATIICPVKVRGGGIYLGDLHAMQGDGEVAGHATDVSGIVQIQVSVLKKVQLEGPIILPNCEDLPYLAKPFSKEEKRIARDLAEDYGIKQIEESLPISVVGTGETINSATQNAVERATNLLGLPATEVKNRATIAGALEIGRLPGVVTLTFQVPKTVLKDARIYKLVKRQYDV